MSSRDALHGKRWFGVFARAVPKLSEGAVPRAVPVSGQVATTMQGMAAAALARVTAAVTLALVPALTSSTAAITPVPDLSSGQVSAPPVAVQPSADGSLVPLGPERGPLDEAAGRRLADWLTVILLDAAGEEATGEPTAMTNGSSRWASRVWLRAGGGLGDGRVSVDVYRDLQARRRWQRDAAALSYLIAGPLWTVTTSSAVDERLVRGYLAQVAARH